MRKLWTVIVPLAAVSVAGIVAMAAAPDWSVAQMSGKVSITVAGAQPVSLSKGALLPTGGVLTTGPSSRATLTRDEQTMVVGANSAVAIPAGKSNPQFTTVLESAGIVTFEVDKQKVQHFAVETPYLAAVVKGTGFTVSITSTDGKVSVDHGIVEVTSLKTGYMVDITAGQSATVKADGTLLVGGPGAPAVAQRGTPHAPLVGYGAAALTASVDVGNGLLGGSVNLGGNGLRAGVNAGPASVNVGLGNQGADASVDAGVASVQASIGDGGVSAGVSVGGTDVGVSVGSGGVGVDVGGVASVDIGSGGVDVDVGGLHIGLGH